MRSTRSYAKAQSLEDLQRHAQQYFLQEELIIDPVTLQIQGTDIPERFSIEFKGAEFVLLEQL